MYVLIYFVYALFSGHVTAIIQSKFHISSFKLLCKKLRDGSSFTILLKYTCFYLKNDKLKRWVFVLIACQSLSSTVLQAPQIWAKFISFCSDQDWCEMIFIVYDIVTPVTFKPDTSTTYILIYVSFSAPQYLSVIYCRWGSGISLQKPLLFRSSKAHLSLAERKLIRDRPAWQMW